MLAWSRKQRRVPFAIAAVAVVAMIILATPAMKAVGAGSSTKYLGAVSGEAQSDVLLKVRKKEGRLPRLYFEARFKQECEDGSVERSASLLDGNFSTKRRFRTSEEDTDPHRGDRSVFVVKGRVGKSGVARGWLTHSVDRPQPPYTGFPDLPDCATDGRRHWRAELPN